MRKVYYTYNGFDESFIKIKNIILVGIIAIAITLIFSYTNNPPFSELIKIMITFLGILFGFFMINLVYWMELYDKLYYRDINVLADSVGRYENTSVAYALSPLELLEKSKAYSKDSAEISNILHTIDFIKKSHEWVRKSSLKIILFLVIFVIGSLLFVYIESAFPIYYKISIFSIFFILFILIFQEILVASIFIHFPKIGQRLSG